MAWTRPTIIEGITKATKGFFETYDEGIEQDEALAKERVLNSEKGAASGVATLNSSKELTASQVPVAVANNSAETINLLTKGAKLDGVTDDTAAWEGAISESNARGGVPIAFPEGESFLAKTPKLPKNITHHIPIIGAGRFSSVVKLGEGALGFLTWMNTAPGDTIGYLYLRHVGVNCGGFAYEGAAPEPVIGTKTTCMENVHIKHVDIDYVRIFNCPALEAAKNGRRAIYLNVSHKEPGETRNDLEHVTIGEHVEIEGSQMGVYVGASVGSGNLPANVRLRHCKISGAHDTGKPAELFGNSCNVQVGQSAWSDGVGMEVGPFIGRNSFDSGIECDVVCTLRDCEVFDANNVNYLLTIFNVATIKEPVMTKLAALGKVGDTKLTVTTITNLIVGGQLVIGEGSEVRTIKALSAGEVELTEGLGIEHVNGTWMQLVDDMSAVSWRVENPRSWQTVGTQPGNKRGYQIQNTNNVRPCPAVEMPVLHHVRTYVGRPTNQGEVLNSETGTANSPTGNPYALRIDDVKARIENLEHSAGTTVSHNPIFIVMLGYMGHFVLGGTGVRVEGPGVTGGGKLEERLYEIRAGADFDINIGGSWTLTSTGNTSARALNVNGENYVGSGRGRIRCNPGVCLIKEGGGAATGVRLGKPSGFTSSFARSKLAKAAAAKAIELELESVEGFIKGQRIVVKAEDTTNSEVHVILSIAGKTLTLQSLGNTANVGLAVEQASGVLVAALNDLVVYDSNWAPLGTGGAGIGADDENVYSAVRTRGCTVPAPQEGRTVTIPTESAKAFRFPTIQRGQPGYLSVTGGTVTAVEWTSGVGAFQKFAGSTATGVIVPIDIDPIIKITWSGEPTVKFVPSRS